MGILDRLRPRVRPPAGARATSTARLFAISEGSDPWIVEHDGRFLWCASIGDRQIAIWDEDTPVELGFPRVVWEAPDEGPYSREVWAPELHRIDERWYVYFAASGGAGTPHLSYVLQSAADDPFGPYELVGSLATGSTLDAEPLWAIDLTTFQIGGRRYAAWSGWQGDAADEQFLYIAAMSSPTQLSSDRVRLAANDTYPWEFTGGFGPRNRGLNQAPQLVPHPTRTLLAFSCGDPVRETSKIGLLELVGSDPRDPASWRKLPEPLVQTDGDLVGPGHGCFFNSVQDGGLWTAVHYKVDRDEGKRRAVTLLRLETSDAPDAPLRLAARYDPREATPARTRLVTNEPTDFSGPAQPGPLVSYYGHRQALAASASATRLGVEPERPVNFYRSGEKLVLRDRSYDDLTAEVTIHFPRSSGRDAGLLFRVTDCGVGFDAQAGYFAGVLRDDNRVVIGKMNGRTWQELASVTPSRPIEETVHLSVSVRGDQILVRVDSRVVLAAKDGEYPAGSVGIRVVDTDASFSGLRAASLV